MSDYEPVNYKGYTFEGGTRGVAVAKLEDGVGLRFSRNFNAYHNLVDALVLKEQILEIHKNESVIKIKITTNAAILLYMALENALGKPEVEKLIEAAKLCLKEAPNGEEEAD